MKKEKRRAGKYLSRANSLLMQKEISLAIEEAQKAVEAFPGDVDVLHEASRIVSKAGNKSLALKYLKTAQGVDSNHVPTLVDLANHFLNSNLLDKADQPVEKLLKVASELSITHNINGIRLQKKAQLDLAVECFRKALAIKLTEPREAPMTAEAISEGFDKPATEELLWDTLSVLARAGIHAFACSGTLLGIVREGGLLPFDKDLDFGVPESEALKAKNVLMRHGWIEVRIPNLINPISFYHLRSGITLDLIKFAIKDERVIGGFWLEGIPMEWARIAYYPSLTLEKKISPNGKPIWHLADAEAWLESIYGEWKKPDPRR